MLLIFGWITEIESIFRARSACNQHKKNYLYSFSVLFFWSPAFLWKYCPQNIKKKNRQEIAVARFSVLKTKHSRDHLFKVIYEKLRTYQHFCCMDLKRRLLLTNGTVARALSSVTVQSHYTIIVIEVTEPLSRKANSEKEAEGTSADYVTSTTATQIEKDRRGRLEENGDRDEERARDHEQELCVYYYHEGVVRALQLSTRSHYLTFLCCIASIITAKQESKELDIDLSLVYYDTVMTL